ncbi:hypothetical protein V8C34DRAFT_299954 [Trichoderma compactum]
MNIWLILHDRKEFEKGNVYLRRAMERDYAEYENNNHPTISVAAKDLALIYEILGFENEKRQTLIGLFSGTREYIQLDEECSKRLAGSSDCDVLTLFFNRASDKIQITEAIVEAAASNSESNITKPLIGRQSNKLPVTTKAIINASANVNYGPEICKLILGDEVGITRDAITTACQNRFTGDGVLTELLSQQGHRLAFLQGTEKLFAPCRYGIGEFGGTMFYLEDEKKGVKIKETVFYL